MRMEWEDPGRVHYPPGRMPPLIDWYAVSDALKERPGQWALVRRDTDRQHVYRIINGLNAAFRDGKYEATTRNNGTYEHPKHGDLYVRYTGPKDN